MNKQHRPSAFDPAGLPDVPIQGDRCTVHLPRYFRDNAWAHGMGTIQDAIAAHASGARSAARKVTFDLTKCCWIDPLPLMSILIEIEHAVSLGMRVRIELPEPDDGPGDLAIGSCQTSPNQLLRFLNTEGFLDHLEWLARRSDCFEYPQLDRRQAYRDLHVMPSYEDCRCLPMKLHTVPTVMDDPGFTQRAVESLLAGIDTRLDARISPQTRERLKYKLDVALNEAIRNVQQHAYEEGTAPRLLALYVRYRAGGLRLDAASRALFEAHARDERAHCPGIDPGWLAEKPGCLEVFVLDRGMGMVRSFESAQRWRANASRFGDVMTSALCGDERRKQTRHGGLHLLHDLMAGTRDYVRMLDDGTWFACATPVPTLGNQTQLLTKAWARMRGLAMHLRLDWQSKTERDQGWTSFKKDESGELWRELGLDEKTCVASMGWFSQQAVIDERFGQALPGNGTRSEWVLWLVRPHRMKSDILAFLKETVAPYACKGARLVIADIPSYEAQTYAAALAELQLSRDEQWPSRFSNIVLCTNRWRFASVDYESGEQHHGYSCLHTDLVEKQIVAPPIEPQPRDIRLALVRWLKWHDSKILWARVNQQRSMFISEKIVWGLDDSSGQPRIISGYIDFAQTARDKLCAAVYRSALSRVLGVMDLSAVRMSPLDQQTTALLWSIHSLEGPAQQPPSIQLNLGSVLVSGSTLQQSVPLSLDLHFFIHSSSQSRGEKPCLLFWLPLHDIDPGRPRLARIGKTATIGPEGWKSFEIPRHDRERRSVGERDPGKTYKDWQSPSPVIVKAGHWSYQGHHDFLAVNTAGAVEAAFFEKNDLARFLVNRILPFLGLTHAHMHTAWQGLWSPPAPEESPQERHTDYGLLVYRSHPSSESIIGRLLEVLTEDGRAIALQRIFAILPVRMQPGGSALLIPPLVREEIRVALSRDNRSHRVLIFDDAAVSGRTLNDLRAALSNIGATRISSLVITNRLRQPADVGGELALQYFWRLDLPIMGREGNCPLCHALDLVQRFSGSLASKNAKEEIDDWLKRWDSVSPLDYWSRGLRPLPLRSPERRKQYCYRQEADDRGRGAYLAEIDLVRSTGLAIHVSELHAMTARDDYCLKKIEQHDDPEVRVELAASQLLLFGNEFNIHGRAALTKVLVRELARLETSSPRVQLGCLVAMASLTQLGPDARKQAVASIDVENLAARTNYAFKIMLAYLVPPDLREPSNDAEIIGMRLLSTAPLSVAEKLRALFLATLSPLGNPHSQALPTLLDELKKDGATTEGAVQNALDSLDRLDELISGLERLLVRLDARGWYANDVVTWKQATDAMMKLLAAYSTTRVGTVVATLESYLQDTRKLAGAYFHRIESAQEYYRNHTFETEVLFKLIGEINWERAGANKWTATGRPVGRGERQIRISATGCADFEIDAGEVWIAWHQGIPEIVSDLMKNAVHASAAMFDHWDDTSRDVAHLWVRVDYGRQHVALTMVNLCDRAPKDIRLRLKSERWAALREIGGSVEPIDVDSNKMGMEVRIPYAAHLSSRPQA